MSYSFRKSHELFARAAQCDAPGNLRPLHPGHHWCPAPIPTSWQRPRAARFWDVDGNEYIDYMCAYGPMILGYANDKIDDAYRKQAGLGSCCSIATVCETCQTQKN